MTAIVKISTVADDGVNGEGFHIFDLFRYESILDVIRYDYKLDPAQPYDGDVPVACFGEQSFIVD